MPVRMLPVEHYVDLIERGVPFSSLLYGDGEFQVMAGLQTGRRFTGYEELVNDKLRQEMLATLEDDGGHVVHRGTDPNLIAWREYPGQDALDFRAMGQAVEDRIPHVLNPNREWVDGVVWERVVREGRAARLLKALHSRRVAVVWNRRMESLRFLHPKVSVYCPARDAWSQVEVMHDLGRTFMHETPVDVIVLCCGLSAVPLGWRLRRDFPEATILDLGSVLDVFAGAGRDRGWRNDLYANRDSGAYEVLVTANLDGVCGPDCGTFKVESSVKSYYLAKGQLRWC